MDVAVKRDPRPEVGDGQARRREESHRRLLVAARKLFVERGYDATRPQDIAHEAGVANGTFYLHFKDKSAVFLAFAADAQRELADDYTAAIDQGADLRARLRSIIEAMLGHAERHPGVLRAAFLDPVMIAPDNDDAWRIYDGMSGLLERVLAEAQPFEADELALLSHGICGFLRHSLIFARRKGVDLDRGVDVIINFIERGVSRFDSWVEEERFEEEDT